MLYSSQFSVLKISYIYHDAASIGKRLKSLECVWSALRQRCLLRDIFKT